MDNQFIGSIKYYAHAARMWNLTGDTSGGVPGFHRMDRFLPSSCLPVVTVYDATRTYSLNQGCLVTLKTSFIKCSFELLPSHCLGCSLARWLRHQKRLFPRMERALRYRRWACLVGGALSWGLCVGSYSTGRVDSSQWSQFSLVVLNWADSNSTGWDPTPLQTTIKFQGKQVCGMPGNCHAQNLHWDF